MYFLNKRKQMFVHKQKQIKRLFLQQSSTFWEQIVCIVLRKAYICTNLTKMCNHYGAKFYRIH